MKKVFTTLAILILSGTSLMSQTPLLNPTLINNQPVVQETNLPSFLFKSSKRSADGPDWFSTTSSLGATATSYSSATLLPDTNLLIVYSNAVSKNYFNSLGVVFDPRSKLFKDAPFTTTKFSNYTVDSLRFYFSYSRFNSIDTLNDTIVVTTFNNTSIDRLRYYPSAYAGMVDYSILDFTAGGPGAVKTKIILTKDDTSRLIQSRVIAVNRTVAGGNAGRNHFGATVSYLPGYRSYSKVEPFDTVANLLTRATDSTNINVFRILYFDDVNDYQETETIPDQQNMGNRVYNHGIVGNHQNRYNLGTTPPSGYFPSIFFNVNFIPAIEFLVQSPNTSINSVTTAKISDIYPNPTRNQDVVIEVNSNVNSNSEIVVTDLSGKVISSSTYALQNGVNEINLSTQGFAKGIYIVNVKGDGINSVSKLIVE